MHRSRLALFAVFAPVAACSTRKDSESTAALLQDSSLARLDLHQAAQRSPRPQLPDACAAVATNAPPASPDKQQAADLTRQAYDAELLGNLQQARTLLRRASRLDGTNKSVAYHLGRTSEALGDRTEAVDAYCHYLALGPAADTADVRQRLGTLSRAPLMVAAASAGSSAPMRRRVSSAPSRTASRSASRAPLRVATVGGVSPVTRGQRPEPDARSTNTADGDVVATSQAAPPVRQPSTTTRTRHGGLSRTQGAGIGAAAGAIIAGATAHSVKGAVLGAAAGGILGAVVAGGSQY